MRSMTASKARANLTQLIDKVTAKHQRDDYWKKK